MCFPARLIPSIIDLVPWRDRVFKFHSWPTMIINNFPCWTSRVPIAMMDMACQVMFRIFFVVRCTDAAFALFAVDLRMYCRRVRLAFVFAHVPNAAQRCIPCGIAEAVGQPCLPNQQKLPSPYAFLSNATNKSLWLVLPRHCSKNVDTVPKINSQTAYHHFAIAEFFPSPFCRLGTAPTKKKHCNASGADQRPRQGQLAVSIFIICFIASCHVNFWCFFPPSSSSGLLAFLFLFRRLY